MGAGLLARRCALLTTAAALALAGAARAAVPVPALTGAVVDQAGLLDRDDVARLEALAANARAAHDGQGVQLQYLIVRSLEGEPIEDYSIRVAEAWKLGSHHQDNGVLITVALDDRAVRIEVGNGVEGELTDVQSSRIIRDAIVPAFRVGRYGDGLYQAGVQVLGALGALPENLVLTRRAPPAARVSSLGILGLVVFFVLLRIFSGFGNRRRRSLWGLPWMIGGSGWRGGGWGGGGGFRGGGFGGGGGGWSGGGGGFSGGGASGRW